MEITYQRNLHKSYMCVETTDDQMEEHELMILQKYRVPGLLPMQMMIQDGKTQYWFGITGKQQLDDYLAGKSIGRDLLKKILFSLEQVCQKIPEFLLSEDRICLNQELIYVDLAEETLYFAYLPFWKGNLPQEFQKWMEETLKQIDHQDRTCVELAYKVYEASREENISIRKLLEESRQGVENGLPLNLEMELEQERLEVREKKVTDQENPERVSWKETLEEKKEQWKNAAYKPFERILKPMQGEKRQIGTPYKKSKKPEKSLEKNVEKGIGEYNLPELEPTKDIKHETELLAVTSQKPKGRLVYQGEHGCDDFWIKTEEFLIGRSLKQADGKILIDGISRLHAKITQKNDEYYIEDLNSTNGTYLNDEMLEYHEKRKLAPNDRVMFGIEEYVFY